MLAYSEDSTYPLNFYFEDEDCTNEETRSYYAGASNQTVACLHNKIFRNDLTITQTNNRFDFEL